MKRSISFLIILISLNAYTQWEWQNPLPQGNDLNAVHFVDSLEGWAAGFYGTVMHTTDGGQNWQIVSLGTTESFQDIEFINPDTGWMVGFNMIYRTTDGGETWNLPESPLPIDACSVCFINRSEGWVAGGSYFTILHTMDGGKTWEEQDSGLGSEFGRLYSIYFIDENNGWACGWHHAILRTTDGGINWEQIGEEMNEPLSKVQFVDNSIGWIAGHDFILRSTDSGESWEQIPFDLFYLTSISFVDPDNGWTCGTNGNIARTNDGGYSWEIMESDASIQLNDIQIYSNGNGYVAGLSGRIQSLNRVENRWESQTSGFRSWFSDVIFVNDSEGWAAGRELYHTSDGGLNWYKQEPEVGATIFAVYFADDLNGWSASANKIFRTRNGGESWQAQLDIGRGVDTMFQKIMFSDTLHGWVIDFYGLAFHTNDGGNTWEQQYSDIVDIQLNSIFALDSLHAWIAGGYGMISRTTDGGKNWTAIYTGSQWSMNWDIQFTDELHGWTIDDGVFYTEDGGLTWTKITNSYPSYGYALHFIDDNIGWMAAQDGGVVHTIDGGYTWEFQNKPNHSRILDVFFMDENNGWAVGQSGIILHTANGGAVGTEEFKVQSEKFNVECYPNPLSDEVTIGYEIDEPSMVKLEIYNHSGQLIKVLASEKQYPGDHQFKWNAASFQPGLYLYKLTVNQSQTSGKLVLVK